MIDLTHASEEGVFIDEGYSKKDELALLQQTKHMPDASKASNKGLQKQSKQKVDRMLSVYLRNPEAILEEERAVKARIQKKKKVEEEQQRQLKEKQKQELEEAAIAAEELAVKKKLKLSKKQRKKRQLELEAAQMLQQSQEQGVQEQLLDLERQKHEKNQEILLNAARFPSATSASSSTVLVSPASASASGNSKRQLVEEPRSSGQTQRKIYRISEPTPVRNPILSQSTKLFDSKVHSKSIEGTGTTKTMIPTPTTTKPSADKIQPILKNAQTSFSKQMNPNKLEAASIQSMPQSSVSVNQLPKQQSQKQSIQKKEECKIEAQTITSKYYLHQVQSAAGNSAEFTQVTSGNQEETNTVGFEEASKEDTSNNEKSLNEEGDTKKKLLQTLLAHQQKDVMVSKQKEAEQNTEQKSKEKGEIKINSRLKQQTEASKNKVAPKPRSPSANRASLIVINSNANVEILDRQKALLERMKEQASREKEAEEQKKQKEKEAREALKKTILSEVRQNLKDEQIAVQELARKQQQQMMSQTTMSISSSETGQKKRISLTQVLGKSMHGTLNEKDEGDENCFGRKTRAIPNVRDLTDWKKKQRLPDATKVFIIKGGYGDLKRALLHRGWVENPQADSPCFNLKFTLMGKDINYDELLPYQIVNHFEKNYHLSTKAGLLQSLRSLTWTLSKDQNEFFPECFYLNDQDDMSAFLHTFKLTKALSILKRYLRVSKLPDRDETLSDSTISATEKGSKKQKDGKQKSFALELALLRVRAQLALFLLVKFSQDVNNVIDDAKSAKGYFGTIEGEDWKMLSDNEVNLESMSSLKREANWIEKVKQILKSDGEWKNQQLEAAKKNESSVMLPAILLPSSQSVNKLLTSNRPLSSQSTKPDSGSSSSNSPVQSGSDSSDEAQFVNLAEMYLKQQEQTDKQFYLKGEDNIWILKPAGLSRGRGITCHSELDDILSEIKQSEVQMHLVVQKYIENPLLVHQRKFDIRAWVVVSEWNPLQIWYYNDCYVRFSADSYSTDNLSNAFQHLTNNAISKNKKTDTKSEDMHPITKQGNMYTQKQLEDFLIELEGYNVFQSKIKPAMMEVIRATVLACCDVEPRKNSFELFGFDVMIDEKYTPWLLEVNTSPCMEYSTEITETLVKAVFEDLPKIVIDNKRQQNTSAGGGQFDTGKFVQIYAGAELPIKSITSLSTQLVCQGTKATRWRSQAKPALEKPPVSQNQNQVKEVEVGGISSDVVIPSAGPSLIDNLPRTNKQTSNP